MSQISHQYRLVTATGAFFVWGGWAFWVNRVPDIQHGYVSGITQGMASFVITLLMVESVRLIALRVPPAYQLWLPPLLTASVNGVVLLVVHSLAKTPNILATIAAPLAVAFCFCLFTSYKIYAGRD